MLNKTTNCEHGEPLSQGQTPRGGNQAPQGLRLDGMVAAGGWIPGGSDREMT
jgi:hypothetical protein